MQFFTLSRRRTDAFPPEAFTPELVAQEGQRVKELYISGLLRQVWKRGDTRAITGMEIYMPERTTFYGSREIGVRDPAGHFITFANFEKHT